MYQRDIAKRLRQVLVNVLSVKYYIKWSCKDLYSIGNEGRIVHKKKQEKDNDLDYFIAFAVTA